MFDSHSKLGIVQIVFYIPVTLLAAHLAFSRHSRPRMVWLILIFFSITPVRIIGGILVIVRGQNPETGITVASMIFLNTGVFPLIAATLGLIRMMSVIEFLIIGGSISLIELIYRSTVHEDINAGINRHLLLSRGLFFVSLGLTIAGGVLEGSDSVSDVKIGIKLVKAGYSLVVVFIACLLAIQAALWARHSGVSNQSRTILMSAASATPFIIVRICYLFLSVFFPLDPRWNNLTGHIVPFLLMGLIMEYCVVSLYLATGFIIPGWKNGRHAHFSN